MRDANGIEMTDMAIMITEKDIYRFDIADYEFRVIPFKSMGFSIGDNDITIRYVNSSTHDEINISYGANLVRLIRSGGFAGTHICMANTLYRWSGGKIHDTRNDIMMDDLTVDTASHTILFTPDEVREMIHITVMKGDYLLAASDPLTDDLSFMFHNGVKIGTNIAKKRVMIGE